MLLVPTVAATATAVTRWGDPAGVMAAVSPAAGLAAGVLAAVLTAPKAHGSDHPVAFALSRYDLRRGPIGGDDAFDVLRTPEGLGVAEEGRASRQRQRHLLLVGLALAVAHSAAATMPVPAPVRAVMGIAGFGLLGWAVSILLSAPLLDPGWQGSPVVLVASGDGHHRIVHDSPAGRACSVIAALRPSRRNACGLSGPSDGICLACVERTATLPAQRVRVAASTVPSRDTLAVLAALAAACTE